MTAYNPASTDSRHELARELTDRLSRGGLQRIFPPRTHEAVYEKKSAADPRLAVRVYTSCDRDGARAVGADAIRVALVYHCANGQIRGIASETRVHRTGEIGRIIARVVERIADIRTVANGVDRCSCGAPKFISKAGRSVCSEICWTR